MIQKCHILCPIPNSINLFPKSLSFKILYEPGFIYVLPRLRITDRRRSEKKRGQVKGPSRPPNRLIYDSSAAFPSRFGDFDQERKCVEKVFDLT